MGVITRSVGAGGANKPADVTEIQQLLNHVAHGKDERFGDGRQTE
jgi:hypothetical protein